MTGSPAYLAPEVASGSSATPASDVWSLGATLYHAVTGKPPYDVGDNLIGALYKIVHEDPPRLPDDHPMAGLLTVMMTRDAEAALDDAAGARRAGAHRPWAALHRGPGPRVRPPSPRGDRHAAAGAPARAAGRDLPAGTAPAGAGWRPPRCSRSRPSWRRTSGPDAAPPRRCPDEQQTRSAETSETTTGSTSPPVTAEDTRAADGRVHHLLPRHRDHATPARPSTG